MEEDRNGDAILFYYGRRPFPLVRVILLIGLGTVRKEGQDQCYVPGFKNEEANHLVGTWALRGMTILGIGNARWRSVMN